MERGIALHCDLLGGLARASRGVEVVLGLRMIVPARGEDAKLRHRRATATDDFLETLNRRKRGELRTNVFQRLPRQISPKVAGDVFLKLGFDLRAPFIRGCHTSGKDGAFEIFFTQVVNAAEHFIECHMRRRDEEHALPRMDGTPDKTDDDC